MASTKIQNLPLKAPIGAMKIPTGGFGDYSITVSSIGDFIIDAFNLATKDYVDNILIEKEDRIDTTGGYLTPTSQNASIPDTTNDVIDEVAQALLDRIEYVKDNFSSAPSHNELVGRSATGAHPSTSISHKSGTVYTYLQQNESDLNNLNNVVVPEINNSLATKQELIETGEALTPVSTQSPVPSVSHTGLNSAIQALLNRTEWLKNNNSVKSVNNKTGDVVLTPSDIATTGTNKLNPTPSLVDVPELLDKNGVRDTNANAQAQALLNLSYYAIDSLKGVPLTVDNFGAKGDGVTDDSAAFQAYVDSPLTGMNVHLGARGRYKISKQVDLKGKNLIGSGMGRISEFYYNLSCIDVDGSSADLLNKTTFLNCGPMIHNLTVRCSNGAGKQVSFIEIDGYLANIQNVSMVNFYNQITVKNALVGFYCKNIWSYYSQNSGIYCDDPDNRVSTTGVFDSIYFQLGDGYAMKFNRDIHGCQFDNIIYESMNGGIRARTVATCDFGQFWCENLKTETSKPWLEVVGTSNSCYGNTFKGYIKLLGGWTDPSSAIAPSSSSNNYGGVSVSSNGVAIGSASNNAKMTMVSTGFRTGNGVIQETRLDQTSTTPISKSRLIGADGAGAPYLAADTYTKLSRKWATYNHGSNNTGAFYAPMMLTYDQSFSTPQINNGWQIVKESTGVYRVERVSGNTSVITNGHIVVGSPLMGSRKGSGAAAMHGLQMIDTYTDSWALYAEAAGFKVFWKDYANNPVDPYRFSVAFTATS